MKNEMLYGDRDIIKSRAIDTIKNRRSLFVSESLNYDDRDAYVSDMALSGVWGDPEDKDFSDDTLQVRVDLLAKLWDVTHCTIKDMCIMAGISQRKLAETFCIPYRTVENWCAGVNECPIYTRLMMQQLLGIFKI